MSNYLACPGGDHWQVTWSVNIFCICICFSHWLHLMNRFLFRSLVPHGGCGITYVSLKTFHPIQILLGIEHLLCQLCFIRLLFIMSDFTICMKIPCRRLTDLVWLGYSIFELNPLGGAWMMSPCASVAANGFFFDAVGIAVFCSTLEESVSWSTYVRIGTINGLPVRSLFETL